MTTSPSSRLVLSLLAGWLLLALVAVTAGVLDRVFPPVVAFGLTALSLAALAFVPALRTWAECVPLRTLVLYHLVRFVGIVFLVMAARGTLPAEWAVPAGWGDIAVAVAAIAVVFLALPVTNRGRWWAVLAWNTFGLIDILFVLGSAARLVRADPTTLEPLLRLPLGLLPTFIVPLVLVTHALIYWRLVRERLREPAIRLPVSVTSSGRSSPSPSARKRS